MVKVRELPVPKSPVEVAVMVTVYESLVGGGYDVPCFTGLRA